MAGIQVPLFHGTWCQISPSSYQTAPGWSHSLWNISSPCHVPRTKLTHSFSKQGAQQTCMLTPPWEPGSVPLHGHRTPHHTDPVLDKLCTSAPSSATKALLHRPPDTSPSCLPQPMTTRRYSQTQGQGWDTGTLLTHPGACHSCHLT